MNTIRESQAAKIAFTNEPVLSLHEADKDFNERRLSLVPHIKAFISGHERFEGKDVNITFLGNGVSSLVSVVEASKERLILKIPLRKKHSEGEGQFLKVWEAAGVRVPHVFEEGKINSHTYVLCEFIDAEILTKAYSREELLEKNLYVEMGSILRAMHAPKANGYGFVVNGKAEYPIFRDWLNSPDLQKKISYVKENKLLDERHGSLTGAFRTLDDFVSRAKESSYCHDDFTADNIFDIRPLVVFDPNPIFNHGYMDLARTIFDTIAHDESEEARSQLIEGYFKGESYEKEALQAAILLYSYMKLPYSHKTHRAKNIRNVQDYLQKLPK